MVERHQVELFPPNSLISAAAEALKAYARYTVARAVSIEIANASGRLDRATKENNRE